MQPSLRYPLIDWLRALAILLMFIYHFSYDLMTFNFMARETFNSFFMTAIGRSCLAIFMFCVGYSLALTHRNGIQWKKFWQRWLKIAGGAGLVSLGTYLSYPTYWIYFGILHCIAVTSIMVLPLLRTPNLSLVLGMAMMIAFVFFNYHLPFFQLDRPSLDYIPVFPWMWSALVGIGLHQFDLHKKIRLPYSRQAFWLSSHSLAIYLVHQPILVGITYVAQQITNNIH